MSDQDDEPTASAPDPTLGAVASKYKLLAPHMSNAEIVDSSAKAKPGDDRHLEFYPPYESENPRPGKITFELFDKMTPQQREDAVAADALHHLGGFQDPEGTKPVDPKWLQMKRDLMVMRNEPQRRVDENAFREEGDHGDTMAAWLQRNRADAYIRAGLFPEQNPDWQRPEGDPEGWTPQQKAHFARMGAYLRTGQDPADTVNAARSVGLVTSDRYAKEHVQRANRLDALAAAISRRS